MDDAIGTIFVGGGFLLPYAFWRYSMRQYGSAEVAANIVFWLSLALFGGEVAALGVNLEDHGAPLGGSWFPPSSGLISLVYPPFAVVTALLLRREARRRLEEEEDELMDRLAVPLVAYLHGPAVPRRSGTAPGIEGTSGSGL